MEQLGGEQLGEDNLLPSTDLGDDYQLGSELQVAPRGAREREADRNPGDLPSAARSRSRSPGARDAGGGGGERKRGEFGGEGGPRKTGVCVAWNHKGFGFIRPDDGQGDDLFCHATQIRDGFMRRLR